MVLRLYASDCEPSAQGKDDSCTTHIRIGSDLDVPQFSAVDYTAVATTPISPPVSPLSPVKPTRPRLQRTSPVTLSPPSAAPRPAFASKNITFEQTASIVTSSLIQLQPPAGCLARASVDLVASSSSGSRRSSVSSTNSTNSSVSSESSTIRKPRLRTIPRFCVSIVRSTYLAVKEFYNPPRTQPPNPVARTDADDRAPPHDARAAASFSLAFAPTRLCIRSAWREAHALRVSCVPATAKLSGWAVA
ncbi:hypothetical protein MVEN_01174500 [Mycena venus]|uniref:Uncharacterized protein n=1 Tax=Mycena venus TaxID=2733690 RepID=A0A8H6Y5M9_9AGAR|nr:hypothetical protein MVEN_01174500 [Mycena venus]